MPCADLGQEEKGKDVIVGLCRADEADQFDARLDMLPWRYRQKA
jgi:hypothetical protein